MSDGKGQTDERIFGAPRRHYRRRYSTREARAGAAVLAALLCVAAWVAWRGAHPDPELFASAPLQHRAPESAVDRGPLPAGLAGPGWQEGRPSSFDATNLYVKIDGREGYYKGFGFRKLHCVTLTSGERTVDVELYDLNTALNALGAAAGELPASAKPELREGTLALIDKNALYLSRGQYYLRAIGSADDEPVRGALAHVRDRAMATLPGQPLPWSYAIFLQLGVPPAKVSYVPENAFSFGFASEVHVGTLPDGETELFLVQRSDEKSAQALAKKFAAGFAEYGEPMGQRAGLAWFKDRYLSRASAAGAVGKRVVGVHGAADDAAGAALYEKLAAAAR